MTKDKNIHKGHRDRMRKRYLEHGIDTFALHEILEMVLYQTVSRKNTNEIAHKLLAYFGSLSAVFNASVEELKRAGASESAAVYLHMMPDIFRLYRQDSLKQNPRLISSKQVADYVVPLLSGSRFEEVYAVFTDAKNRVVGQRQISQGSPSKVDVSIRDVAQHALNFRATGVIIGHSHPSGKVDPSEADKRFTKLLYETLMSLDMVLLEHLIVGDNGSYFSFFSNGDIAQLRDEYKSKYPATGLSQLVEDFKE